MPCSAPSPCATRNDPFPRQRPGTGAVSTACDLAGNVVSTTDGLGHVTSATSDHANRKAASGAVLGGTRTFGDDAAGHRTVAIDLAGNRRATAYDAVNRQTSETRAPRLARHSALARWARMATISPEELIARTLA